MKTLAAEPAASNRAPADRASDDQIVIPRSRWKIFGVAFVLCFAAMMLWNLASPLASVPDEPSHFIRAASVVRGQINAPPLPSKPTVNEAVVPNYVSHTLGMICFAFHPDITASCQHPAPGNQNTLMTTGQTAQANNPVFYAMVGLPSLVLSGFKGLYAMRAVNVLLCSLMVAFTFMSLSQLRRPRWSYIAAFVSVTPMILYLGGSVNPNALEATAAGSLFAALTILLSFPSTTRLLIERVGIVFLSTFLLVSTRNISLLWVLLALGAALLLSRGKVLTRLIRQPIVWVGVALSTASCALALLWFIQPSVTEPQPPFQGVGTSFLVGFVYMLTQTFDFGLGWIGFFGWVDTPAPGITIVAYASGMVALVLAAISLVRKRQLWAVLGLVIAAVLVPAIAQAAVVTSTGYIWQGRYTLAIIVMLMLACGIVLDLAHVPTQARGIRIGTTIMVAFLGVGHLAAFATALKRYMIGADASWYLMFTHPQWVPPVNWFLLCVGLLIVLGLASLAVLWASFRPSEFDGSAANQVPPSASLPPLRGSSP